MDLFLWRHADALTGVLDFLRELSPKGHKQAGKAAQWFRENADASVLTNLRIFVSPAIRTRQTVAHFCDDESKIQLCNPLYDDASPDKILKIIDWPNTVSPALIVGHQPYMGMFAYSLIGDITQPYSFRKGALWWLRNKPGKKDWQLVDMIEP